MKTCIQALERIKTANRPIRSEESKRGNGASDYENADGSSNADAVADEISNTLEALVGTTDDIAPKPEPRHPQSDSTTGKFTNLQFGRNYDPTKR